MKPMNWTRRTVLASGAALLSAPAMARVADASGIRLTALPLGAPVEQAAAALAEERVRGGQRFGDGYFYETPVFERVFARQRLLLEGRGGNLHRVAAIVEPSFADEIQKTFDDVFGVLLSRHGRPDLDRNRGQFSRNLAIDLETGRFRRLFEWRTGGGQLRFGIPRRLDRRLRVEVHFAKRLGVTTESDWGVALH